MAQDQEPVRQRLLSEATRLFAEQGFESTSVQEIVTAAGVTKGAMYHYFDSKDDLLREIYGRVLRMQMERLVQFADGPGTVTERLYGAAADVVQTSVENLDDSKIFFRSMHLLAPDTRKGVRAERRVYHERFRDLILEGQREGVFRTDTPADIVVDFFFGSVHHLNTWYSPEGPISGAALGAYYADLLLTSLRPQDRPAG
ncbi:TetR/AcrR family transcriptional regulator [Planomonospora sp. ID91781]|uniref:TetR family transcriptional regulator n=3 Tax=Planomonospora TaxID=1998 RepID=A0A161LN56_9ACTN|nr:MULTISPECIES: TetR/AcrR family transcriptional regulator [Planomonospora]MBG0825145.1 TetR/AcrR family transcriptional regulator [Planomonospora sp. ID91781]GAT70757.1 tetR family transcriptional regulator [Planomonospora sphaerica]GGK52461.1 TetR family transcriptional regulator [Planomonospora parontospora]GII06867.1 TetR family transcriptional regulator [Planomonospora parontospora subsp. parontospora]